MKKRSWKYRGRKKGTKEKVRDIGVVGYVNPVSKSQALKRVKRDNPSYVITSIK